MLVKMKFNKICKTSKEPGEIFIYTNNDSSLTCMHILITSIGNNTENNNGK